MLKVKLGEDMIIIGRLCLVMEMVMNAWRAVSPFWHKTSHLNVQYIKFSFLLVCHMISLVPLLDVDVDRHEAMLLIPSSRPLLTFGNRFLHLLHQYLSSTFFAVLPISTLVLQSKQDFV